MISTSRSSQPLSVVLTRAAIDCLVLVAALLAVHGPWLFFDIFAPAFDVDVHYRWADGFVTNLNAGVWQPVWVPRSRGTLGDPVFLYYAPLFYYLVAAVDQLAGDVWTSIKVVCSAGALGCGAVALSFARAQGLGPWMSRAAGVLFIALPVFVVIRNYIGAYPWFFALLPMLLAFVFLVRVLQAPSARSAVGLAAARGAGFATHTLSGASFLLVAGLAVCVDWVVHDRGMAGLRRVLSLAGVAVLGLGLAAWTLLPALAELDQIFSAGWQHLDPRYPAWFNTFIVPFFTDVVNVPFSYVMPSGTVALLPFLVIAAWRLTPTGDAARPVRIMLWTAALGLFLASDLSYFLWANVSPLQIFQRPMRFVPVASMAMVIAGILLLARLPHRAAGAWRWGAVSAVAVALLPIATIVVDSHIGDRVKGPAHTPTKQALEVFFAAPEHLSAAAGPHWQDWLDAGGFATECETRGAACAGGWVRPGALEWTIAVEHPTTLRLPLMTFPGWTALVNGKETRFETDPETGLYLAALPAGAHTVAMRWAILPSQVLGRWVSVLAVMVCLGLLVRARAGPV